MQKIRFFHCIVLSRDIVDLKTLQSDWPRAFWSISQEQDFYNIIFHYGPNSEKNSY